MTSVVTFISSISPDEVLDKLKSKRLDNLKRILQLRVSMYIYTITDIDNFVHSIRPKEYSTKIIKKRDKDILLLKDAVNINEFNSRYFFYIDYYTLDKVELSSDWPDPYKIKLFNNKFIYNDYLIGGDISQIDKEVNLIWSDYRNERSELCKCKCGGNSDLLNYHNKSVLNYFRKEKPIDKDIVNQLAVGTIINNGYRKNHKVKLLAVATKEVEKDVYQKLLDSSSYYGYDLQLIGRDQSLTDFDTAVKICRRYLKEVKTKYSVLINPRNTFLLGSSDELYSKIKRSDKQLLIGGCNQYYSRVDRSIIEYFRNVVNTTNVSCIYPYSSFIIGKTEDLLKLTKKCLGYTIDNIGYYNIIVRKEIDLCIDYQCKFIGNVTDKDQYSFDFNKKRYRNNESGEYPLALHFIQDKNDNIEEMYANSNSNLSKYNYNDNSSFWLVVLIVVIIFVGIILHVIY